MLLLLGPVLCVVSIVSLQLGTSSFNCNWGSFIPVTDVAGYFVLLSASSEGFDLSSLLAEYLIGWRCNNCGLGCLPFGSGLFED
jgi:hypothetical protein